MADKDDPRYLECRHCGERDCIEVVVTLKAAVGDGVPWLDTNSRPTEVSHWFCSKCAHEDSDRAEVCFIGYPGITDEEKEAQRHE